MYGLKHDSLIFKLKQPETKLGRHTSNDVILTKSLKVSRFHAVISFHNNVPLIKDISEWGVYLNNSPVCKHRWAELKLGDVIALGALTEEDGGRTLKVVAWESEDVNSTTTNTNRQQIEVIDITEGDGDDVIDISDDDSKVQDDIRKPPPAFPADRVNDDTTKPAEISIISDGEDEVIFSIPSRKSEEPISKPVANVEIPSTNQTIVSCDEIEINPKNIVEIPSIVQTNILSSSLNETDPLAADEISSIDQTNVLLNPSYKTKVETSLIDQTSISSNETADSKFIDVTPSMNGLLIKTPFEYSKAFQSILTYSSDNEDYLSFDESTNLTVNEDVKFDKKDVKPCLSVQITEDVKVKLKPEITKDVKVELDPLMSEDVEDEHKGWSTRVKPEVHKNWLKPEQNSDEVYKSPLHVFSGFYDENECNAESSDDPLSSPTDEKPAPIIHRTLLTNKIAKIAIISPLPNKSVVPKRRKRVRSESPETIYQRVANAERSQKSLMSPPLPKLRSSCRDSQKCLPASLDVPKMKNVGPDQSLVANAIKQAREKVKALYPAPPTKVKRTPKTRTQPKVKVTDKNRGDFLTKLDPMPSHRSPAKVIDPLKNEPVVSDEHVNEPKNDVTISAKPTTQSTTRGTEIEPEPKPVTSNEQLRSIDEILDDIEVPAVTIDDNVNDIVPCVTTKKTIEVCVNFTKAAPLKFPATGSGLKLMGESILKKSVNEAPSAEKKRVSFRKKIVTGYMNDDDNDSRLFFSTMMKNIWPTADCHNCGGNGHSTKRCPKDPVCYNCLRVGHIAISCSRPIMCFNCKRTGHKSSDCTYSDVRLNDSKSKERPFKSNNRDNDYSSYDNVKRNRIRDPRLRPLNNGKQDEST